MIKKDYMKPATKVVQLQHRQHILAGSYTGIQSTNNSDDDDPDYDGSSSSSINIWGAN